MDKTNQPEINWDSSKMASQKGKVALITGGTGGLGFADAKALALKGAKVIIIGRNQKKGSEAIERIKKIDANSDVSFFPVDLGNLSAIKSFADQMNKQLYRLDILINNAGVMMPAKRQLTADGFELQFGTNYLSHFALTGEVFPILKKTDGARVVTIATLPGRYRIDFDNLQSEKRYSAWVAYGQSKLAELIFALHLQRLSERNKWGISSMAAHPGLSVTDLVTEQAGSNTGMMAVMRAMFRIFPFMRQTADKGSLPALFAATAPKAIGGMHYGPNGFGEMSGYPALAKINSQAKDVQIADRLWSISEKLTRISYPR
ncbi:MAG: SDR family oxidoreductase [Clostridiales bacterium]|jgi:NAD(P)-dependent dehydrogenase (short-subunit alcohol dehydrogenase family)|nr:SDR family oxidoreductase [Clostridiales bacterium]